MAKELNRDELIESFEKEGEKAAQRLEALTERENELETRIAEAQAKFDERMAKTRARLADVQAKADAEQAKVDAVAAKIEWARTMPAPDNAPVAAEADDFGSKVPVSDEQDALPA